MSFLKNTIVLQFKHPRVLIDGLMKISQVSHDQELCLFSPILRTHKASWYRRIWTHSCVVHIVKAFIMSSGCSWQPGATFQIQGLSHSLDNPLPEWQIIELHLWSYQQLLQKCTRHLNASLHPCNLRHLKGCSYMSTCTVIFSWDRSHNFTGEKFSLWK